MPVQDFVLNQEVELARFIEQGITIFKDEHLSTEDIDAFTAACAGKAGGREKGFSAFMKLKEATHSDDLLVLAELLGITSALVAEVYARGREEGVKAEMMAMLLRREDWHFTLRSPGAGRDRSVVPARLSTK